MMTSPVAQVRAVITEWNFGPLGDRDALVAIWRIVGDDFQHASSVPCLTDALFTILASTEEGAIKHASYEDLAKSIADTCRAVLSKAQVQP